MTSRNHVRKISQLRPALAQPDPHIQSNDKTSPGFEEDDDADEGYGIV